MRLERAVLQQSKSRYEVQGEWVMPPNVEIPKTMAAASSGATGPAMAAPASRWRVQVRAAGRRLRDRVLLGLSHEVEGAGEGGWVAAEG